MTLQEALAIAARAKPKPPKRIAFDKLAGSDALAKHVAGVTALVKSFDVMGGTLAMAQGQLAKVAADVEYIENFTPNSPIRRFHS